MANPRKKKETTAPIIKESIVVAPPVRKELVLEGDPEQQLIFAKKAADALMNWVKQKPHKVMIRGEQYLEFGDWQILGRFYGATVGIEWTKGIEKGWEARAIVTRNGEQLSSAEAMCTRAEKNWKDRDEFMLKSMAQTRASAKALRQAFGWVAELAGMKSTPAEEMGSSYDQTPVAEDAIPTVSYDDHEGPATEGTKIEAPTDVTAQRKRIFTLLKERGVDITNGKACREYVADTTQLSLVENNYTKIIKLLEQ